MKVEIVKLTQRTSPYIEPIRVKLGTPVIYMDISSQELQCFTLFLVLCLHCPFTVFIACPRYKPQLLDFYLRTNLLTLRLNSHHVQHFCSSIQPPTHIQIRLFIMSPSTPNTLKAHKIPAPCTASNMIHSIAKLGKYCSEILWPFPLVSVSQLFAFNNHVSSTNTATRLHLAHR
jgi:hypothetical protein